jgi:transcriptional regulator with XRE-family HTH domain
MDYQTEGIEVPDIPDGGWLKGVRQSRNLSQREVAERAGVSQQAFDQFERGEMKGSVTLETLRNAADALDSELVYFLRPRRAGGRRSARRSGTGSAASYVGGDEELPVNLL